MNLKKFSYILSSTILINNFSVFAETQRDMSEFKIKESKEEYFKNRNNDDWMNAKPYSAEEKKEEKNI